jgi:hypothetical protein
LESVNMVHGFLAACARTSAAFIGCESGTLGCAPARSPGVGPDSGHAACADCLWYRAIPGIALRRLRRILASYPSNGLRCNCRESPG